MNFLWNISIFNVVGLVKSMIELGTDQYYCSQCNTCQTYCQQNQTPYDSFSYSYQPEKDKIIGPGYFSREVWNEGFERINSILSKGKYDEDRGLISKTTLPYLTAEDFNRIANKVGATNVKVGQLIEAQLFTNLANKIASFQYLTGQCESCNSGCNTCDQQTHCESCDSCECESDEDDCPGGCDLCLQR